MQVRWALKQKGFTIVELLIVIVVIGILAAVVIVAYNGIQNRAFDSAVQADLKNIANKMRMYETVNGTYPIGSAQLATLDLKVNKSAYDHYFNGVSYYNIVYCRIPAAAPTQFALVAYGKSGKNWQYNAAGELKEYTGVKAGSVTACGNAGITITNERDWFYDSGAWQSYVSG